MRELTSAKRLCQDFVWDKSGPGWQEEEVKGSNVIPRLPRPTRSAHRMYQLISSKKSPPPPNCQLILYISNYKGYVDSFVGDLTFANDFINTSSEIKAAPVDRRRRPQWLQRHPEAASSYTLISQHVFIN